MKIREVDAQETKTEFVVGGVYRHTKDNYVGLLMQNIAGLYPPYILVNLEDGDYIMGIEGPNDPDMLDLEYIPDAELVIPRRKEALSKR